MLKPNFLLPPRLLRSANTPRYFQSQCRRLKPDSASEHPLIANRLPPLQRPRFEKAISEKSSFPKEPEPKSFHPALAGFFAGAMVAFTTSYLLYLFSGTYNMRKAATDTVTKLNKEQERVSGVIDKKLGDISSQEAIDWFYRTAAYYSAFMPNSDQYVGRVREEMHNHLKTGKEKEQKIVQIVKECAEELRQEVGKGMFDASFMNGLGLGKKGWSIVMKHLERVRYLDGKPEDKREKK